MSDTSAVMVRLGRAREFSGLIPKGRYPVQIASAVCEFSKKESRKQDGTMGHAPMIVLESTITEGEYEGKSVKDWLIIDDQFSGSGMAKPKLRGLIGNPGECVDGNGAIPVDDICNSLVGGNFLIDLDLLPREDPDPVNPSKKIIKMETTVNASGQVVQVPVMQNKVAAYYSHGIGQVAAIPTARPAQATQPIPQQQAPQYQPMQHQQAPMGPPPGYAPTQQYQQAPAQPQQAQYQTPIQQAPQGYAQPPQYQQAPQGYAQPVLQAAPVQGGQAPFISGPPAGEIHPGWVGQQIPNGSGGAQAEAPTGGKGKRGKAAPAQG